MTATATFNLVDEPWIEVLDDVGSPRTLSIRDVFRQSTQLRRISGELPTQDAAILRLLLAILYRALPVEGDDEIVREAWGKWWSARSFPISAVERYLDDWQDRFDLLHPTHPFFQVADLHTASGNTSGIGALIGDHPAGHKFFTTRAGEGAESLPLDEAARWVCHCQAFDPSGIKSGAVGDDRVIGGKGYPIGTGWAGNLGLVVMEGETLAQTLLLNLVLTRRSPQDDLPPWEVDAWTAASAGRETPRGPADVLTWQIRRIRLHVQDGKVVDALISNGDRIRVRNQQGVETMSAWRRSEPQEKKHRESLVYMPRTHNPERAVWRGLDALISASTVETGARNGAQSLNPENVTWVGDLQAHEHLGSDTLVTIHTVGAQYGTQNAFIETIINDRITLRAEVLDTAELRDCANRAVRVVDAVVKQVGRLAENLSLAAGREGQTDRPRAMEQCLQRFDPLYRAWLLDLTAATVTEHEETWHEIARSLALELGEEMFTAAPRQSLRGRVISDRNNKQMLLDAALAHRWFVQQIWTDIPQAGDSRPRTSKEIA